MDQTVIKTKYKRPNPEKDRIWRLENKERLNQKSLLYNSEHKKELKEYRLQNREKLNQTSTNWQKENKEKASANHINYVRRRLQKDPFFKFSQIVRSLINKSFKRGVKTLRKNNKTIDILGCSIEFFIEYILSKCPEGVTLKDFSRFGYHIDHKVPISTAKNEQDVLKLCHYTNFQPLWWRDNIIKSNKVD